MDKTKFSYEQKEVVNNYYTRYQNAPEYFQIDIPKFIDYLPGKRLLDVGCGPGQFAIKFAELGLEVTAIDYSKEMIKKAKSLSTSKSNPKYLVMDMRDISDKFPQNSFDVIWATVSLLHLNKSEVPAVLRGFTKILIDGGIVYLLIKVGNLRIKYLIDNKLGKNIIRIFSFWDEKSLRSCLDHVVSRC